MIEHDLMIEAATPKSLAPYGVFVGAHASLPLFAQWPGATVYGKVQIDVGTGGELLHVVLQAREMPAEVELLERHFLHTQTYLPANGKPFVVVMGDKTQGGLPDVRSLRAFLFRNGAGIALHKGIWHEFPLALEDDTRFTVILREEAHINQLDRPEQPLDARGPDLERYDMAGRARVMVFPMTGINRQLRVKAWPKGLPAAEYFEIAKCPIPVPGDAQVLIRNLWLSIDPYYRHALGPRFVGTPFRQPGDVMMAVSLGEVIESHDARIPVGCHVTTLSRDMQDYAVLDSRDVRLLPDDIFGPGKLPLSTTLGVAGIPGLTAYAALVAHARPIPGETFVVSSACGCVGAPAGQLAKIMGLRAVGIAGSGEKMRMEEVAGFYACISRRSPAFPAELAAACPAGIDINMEHVGGKVLDTILPLMKPYGRVVMSGLIDQYNKDAAPPGPNWGLILQRQLIVSGLRVFDHFDLMPQYKRLVAPRIMDGSFAFAEDLRDGLEEAPAALASVLTGANFGKSLIRLA